MGILWQKEHTLRMNGLSMDLRFRLKVESVRFLEFLILQVLEVKLQEHVVIPIWVHPTRLVLAEDLVKACGGIPGQPGDNCEPLGNALIVQEPGESCPDDNVDGGIINIVFPATNGQYVYELGMLDVDYGVTIEVGYETSTGFQQQNIRVPLLGDNSYQVVGINQANVKWIKVKLTRSGAITSIKLCPEESVTPPPSGTQPTTSPLLPTARPPSLRLPSASPPTSGSTPTKPGPAPTSAPGDCNLVTVGFDKDANWAICSRRMATIWNDIVCGRRHWKFATNL